MTQTPSVRVIRTAKVPFPRELQFVRKQLGAKVCLPFQTYNKADLLGELLKVSVKRQIFRRELFSIPSVRTEEIILHLGISPGWIQSGGLRGRGRE